MLRYYILCSVCKKNSNLMGSFPREINLQGIFFFFFFFFFFFSFFFLSFKEKWEGWHYDRLRKMWRALHVLHVNHFQQNFTEMILNWLSPQPQTRKSLCPNSPHTTHNSIAQSWYTLIFSFDPQFSCAILTCIDIFIWPTICCAIMSYSDILIFSNYLY